MPSAQAQAKKDEQEREWMDLQPIVRILAKSTPTNSTEYILRNAWNEQASALNACKGKAPM